MRLSRFLGAGVMLLAFSVGGIAQTFIWTGLGTGWRGQGFPPNDGSANLVYENGLRDRVTLYGNANLDSITLVGDSNFFFVRDSGAPLPATVTLTNGLNYAPSADPEGAGNGRYDFAADIDLAISGPQTFDVGGHVVILRGHLTGTDDITLTGAFVNGSAGSFIFANSDTGNSGFSGNVTVSFADTSPSIAFWNSSPFGTGEVTFTGGATLSAHGTQTIANNLTLSTAGANVLSIRSWDDTLTFSGSVTLANNTGITSVQAPAALDFAAGTGSLATPGTPSRNPLLFTGNIGETGGARQLTIAGASLVILAPTVGANTYSGGTVVNGHLVFANNGALPATGSVAVNANGYAGIGDLTPGNFFTQVNAHFAKGSAGGIGVDTLPGNATVVFADDINLSSVGASALGFTNSSVRIGTATSAILTGNLTPQGTNYNFGNGGGFLYVQSNLSNTTASGTATRGVNVNGNGGFPLSLYLQGTNTYTGGTSTDNGIIVFDGASALPATGTLTAGLNAGAFVGSSYIGYTDSTGLTPAAFLARFDAVNTQGIVGFDTHAGNATVSIGAIDLTGFKDGVYIGTTTSAILNGPITGTTVANGSNAANTLRFTATNGGTLTLATALTDGAGAQAVMLGSAGSNGQTFGNGTIILNGANTYSGGTTIQASGFGSTIVAGSSAAFGTGAIVINSLNGSFFTGLMAATAGLDIANDIAFAGSSSGLHLLGNNPITLSGDISGLGLIQLQRDMAGPTGEATLAGDNSDFAGQINVQHSTLHLAHDYASGDAVLRLFSSDAEIVFDTLNPHVAGIFSDTGTLILGAGANLTFDTWHEDWDFEFQGNITGAGGSAVNASITVDGGFSPDNQVVYLAGNNTYTGGTSVLHDGVLVLGSNQAAGTGTITVNSLQGGLGLNTGVTLTNPIVLTQGALAGYGTFAPTSFNGVPGAPITIGANQFIIPTLPGITHVAGGTLSIAGDLVFTDGGGFIWSLQDPTFTDGYGLVAVSGMLNLSSLSPGGFTLYLQSFNADGYDGNANLTWGATYNFTILTAAGGITGFDSNQFVFNAWDFQDGQISPSEFSLSVSGNNLVLHFTAVPEPSTWALLLTGGAGLGLAAWRRRKRA